MKKSFIAGIILIITIFNSIANSNFQGTASTVLPFQEAYTMLENNKLKIFQKHSDLTSFLDSKIEIFFLSLQINPSNPKLFIDDFIENSLLPLKTAIDQLITQIHDQYSSIKGFKMNSMQKIDDFINIQNLGEDFFLLLEDIQLALNNSKINQIDKSILTLNDFNKKVNEISKHYIPLEQNLNAILKSLVSIESNAENITLDELKVELEKLLSTSIQINTAKDVIL